MAASLRLVPLAAFAACGRAGFDPELPPAGACDWTDELALQAPEPLEGINTGARDSAPFVTAGGDTLYFSSDTGGTSDFYSALIDASLQLGASEFVEDLSSDAEDTSLSFAADNQEAFFASNRGGAGSDIYRATRPALQAPFRGEERVAGVASESDDLSPHLAESGLALYFATARGGVRDLYVARRASADDGFGSPELIAELSSGADETSPSLTANGRVIVFASTRDGSSDLYYATRRSPDEPFGAPVPLAGLNTGGVETDPFVTRDGCFLYFASDRGGGALDLFVARAFR